MQVEQQITRIGQKLQQLVKRCGELQAENEQLRRRLQVSEEQCRAEAEKAAGLQQNLLTLKSTLNQLTEEEKKQFEKRLNSYIRDIEKAITLLGE